MRRRRADGAAAARTRGRRRETPDDARAIARGAVRHPLRSHGVKPEVAIARRAFRQVWIGAIIWALAFGLSVLATALTYVSTFPDEASRQAVARGAGSD